MDFAEKLGLVISLPKTRTTTRNIFLKQREHFSRVVRVQKLINWHIIVQIKSRWASSFKVSSKLRGNINNFSASNFCIRNWNINILGTSQELRSNNRIIFFGHLNVISNSLVCLFSFHGSQVSL